MGGCTRILLFPQRDVLFRVIVKIHDGERDMPEYELVGIGDEAFRDSVSRMMDDAELTDSVER